jgi:hypothetical protein
MKKLLSLVAISLMLLGITNAHARNSAATYDTKFWSQQEFVQGYNNSTGTIYRDFVVGLDTTPNINPNLNLGQYITQTTSSTTDNLYVFGVADETIPAGQLGRICIRGAHKVVYNTTVSNTPTAGMVLSQCKNAVTYGSSTLIGGGGACQYTTATGTAGGSLGYVLSATATTDTGDVGQTTNQQGNTTWSEYWSWINPQTLR